MSRHTREILRARLPTDIFETGCGSTIAGGGLGRFNQQDDCDSGKSRNAATLLCKVKGKTHPEAMAGGRRRLLARHHYIEKLIPRYQERPTALYTEVSVLFCELETLTDSSSVKLVTPARICKFSVSS